MPLLGFVKVVVRNSDNVPENEENGNTSIYYSGGPEGSFLLDENLLNNIKFIYTEINTNYLYKDCALVSEIDEYLKNFIEALPHLELFIVGSSFKHQVEKDIVFVLLRNAFLLGGKNITLTMIIQVVCQDSFMVKVYFNIVVIKGMIITQQLSTILQICLIINQDRHRLRSIME